MIKKIFSYFLLLLLLGSCAENEDAPIGTQLLGNSNISSSPENVFPWIANKNTGVELGVSKDVFMTGFQSLYIENMDSTTNNSASWSQTYSGPMPSTGRSLELTAFLKGENIKRFNKLSVFIYFTVIPNYDSNGNSLGNSVSSGNTVILEGDFDWIPVKITLEDFPVNAESISVALIMPGTVTGKIYFDEITLTVK